jgi:hypothetical protein
MEVPIELCQSAKVYKSDPIRRYVLLGLLLMIYAFSIPFCYYTAGEPRKAAMIAAQKLADEKWALESSSAAAAAITLRATTALLTTDYMNTTNDTTNNNNTTINNDDNSSLHKLDNEVNDQLLDIDKAIFDNSNNNYDDNFISINELSGTLVEMDSSGLIDIDSDTNDMLNANNNYIGGADYNSKLGVKKSMGGGNHHEDEFDIDHVVSFDSSADAKGYDTTIAITTTNTSATICYTNTFS